MTQAPTPNPVAAPGSPRPRSGPRHARKRAHRTWLGLVVVLVVVLVAAAAGGAWWVVRHHSTPAPPARTAADRHGTTRAVTHGAPATTTSAATTAPPVGSGSAVKVGPLTSPPLPAPGPGFVPNHVTAVGDSVMLDYQTPLQQDIPGIDVEAAVSRQWYVGEQLLQQLKSEGTLGAVVIVGLSTNGPISDSDFDAMMSILSGASRVVFVNIVVDQPWQDPNNAVLAAGVARYHNTVLADWNGLESKNPGWVYSDGTHLPIDGPGAQALAALVASVA